MRRALGPSAKHIDRIIEGRRLARLPTAAEVDTSALGRLSRAQLTDLLRSASFADGWKAVQSDLGPVQLGEMNGGINPGDRRAIYHLVRALAPASVLEIGTHVGYSTVAIARALRDGDRHEQPLVRTVDVRDVNDPATRPWEENRSPVSPEKLVSDLGCGDLVEFKVADSLDHLASDAERYDLIFLDGLHTAERLYQEIPLALRRLTKGGLVLLHDYFPGLQALWPDGRVIQGPALAVGRLRDEDAPVEALPLGELPWPTKLGTSTTSLALLVAP